MTEPQDDLDRLVAGLPRSIEPAEELWGGIEARIQSREHARARRRRVALGGAATLAAAVALAIVVAPAASDDPRPAVDEPITISSRPASPPTEPATSPFDDLEEAAAELTLAFVQRRGLLAQELLAVYDENLGVIDDAIRRSRAALAVEPDDPHLHDVLVQAYRHKLTVLRRATAEDQVRP